MIVATGGLVYYFRNGFTGEVEKVDMKDVDLITVIDDELVDE